jgi:hypothetical protein
LRRLTDDGKAELITTAGVIIASVTIWIVVKAIG